MPASVSPRCPGKPRRWPWVSVHRAPACCSVNQLAVQCAACTSLLHTNPAAPPLLRPALQLHPELLFSAAARPKVSPSLVPPAKRIISNDLAGGLAAAFSLRVLNLDYCRLLTQINNSQGHSQSCCCCNWTELQNEELKRKKSGPQDLFFRTCFLSIPAQGFSFLSLFSF